MLILLTNDDGHDARGLAAARHALSAIGHVVTVAPAREMSGVSHAITLGRPLAVERLGDDVHAVDGTPADCVSLALHRILPERPDVLVSGINHGPNLGDDVSYSGTVGAAAEGALNGVPALAVSQLMDEDGADFAAGALRAAAVARCLASRTVELPEGTFLSLNVPAHPDPACTELAITRLARRRYLDPVGEQRDDEGRSFFWIGGRPVWSAEPGTDHEAVVRRGISSVSLLRTDCGGVLNEAAREALAALGPLGAGEPDVPSPSAGGVRGACS